LEVDEMDEGLKSDESRVLIGVVPGRLGVSTRRRRIPKSVADKAHERVVDQAIHWQRMGSNAVSWEMGAALRGSSEDQTYALAGQMASAGEQLALAYAAAIEVALWREFRENAAHDAEHEMCMRGTAEAQCLFVIGTGHALANVAVRALAIDPKLRAELTKEFRRGNEPRTFQPFSEERGNWVSLNDGTCTKIQAVARFSGSEEVVQLVEPVTSFTCGQVWHDLVERRGEDFHRWRRQTHGIEGVPHSSPWKRESHKRRLTLGHPTYDEASGLAEETACLASQAMLDLALAMETFMTRWFIASEHLGGPRFKLSSD
jgi:hypothetical protein